MLRAYTSFTIDLPVFDPSNSLVQRLRRVFKPFDNIDAVCDFALLSQ